MKPKEWLLKNGHIKEITRGRLSRDNIALIEEAVKNGARIEGYSVSTAAKSDKAEPVVEKTQVNTNRIADIPEFPLREESQWEAYANVNGKLTTIGMRTVCNTCHCSLTYCGCRTPYVWVDAETQAVVNFKPRSKPLPNRRW